MPRNVRNFWLELSVDGRSEEVKTGPVAKDGGFILRLYIRDRGVVREVGTLEGLALEDGRLELRLWDGAKKVLETLAEGRR